MKFHFVLALLALAISSFAGPLDDIPRIGGFVAGVHAWTFNKGTLFEAIDQTRAAGGNTLEVYLMGMKLSPELPEVVFDETLSDAHLDLLQTKMAASGVRIINAYIGSKQWQRIEQNEDELRKFFVFGKKLGIYGFTGEPAERQWDMLEKLLVEFDLTFSVHNHIKGFEAPYIGGEYRYWDPNYTFTRLEEQKRDARFGICFDTGHYLRSGGDVVQTLQKIGKRVISVHLKDVVAADPDGHDVPYGTGIGDIPAVVAELRRQKLHGHIAVEYEWVTPHLFDDVKQCFTFLAKQSGS